MLPILASVIIQQISEFVKKVNGEGFYIFAEM